MTDLDHEFVRAERHSLLDMLENKNQMAGRVRKANKNLKNYYLN